MPDTIVFTDTSLQHHALLLENVQIEGRYGLEWWDTLDQVSGWDVLKLGDVVMPGIWQVSSGECARQVDHKKTKDKDGARIRDLGMLPARFTAKGEMQTHADWVALQQVIPDINPRRKGGIKQPLAIYHPAIALLGITTIYVERVRAPTIRNGILEIGIDIIEWSDPAETRTSDRIKSTKGGTQDALDEQLARAHLQGLGILISKNSGGDVNFVPGTALYDDQGRRLKSDTDIRGHLIGDKLSHADGGVTNRPDLVDVGNPTFALNKDSVQAQGDSPTDQRYQKSPAELREQRQQGEIASLLSKPSDGLNDPNMRFTRDVGPAF